MGASGIYVLRFFGVLHSEIFMYTLGTFFAADNIWCRIFKSITKIGISGIFAHQIDLTDRKFFNVSEIQHMNVFNIPLFINLRKITLF